MFNEKKIIKEVKQAYQQADDHIWSLNEEDAESSIPVVYHDGESNYGWQEDGDAGFWVNIDPVVTIKLSNLTDDQLEAEVKQQLSDAQDRVEVVASL